VIALLPLGDLLLSLSRDGRLTVRFAAAQGLPAAAAGH
jgi:hypothetical protein